MEIAAALFRQLADTTRQGVILTDHQRKIIYVNRAFEHTTGYAFNEVKGQDPRLLQSEKHDGLFYRNMWKSIVSKGYWQGEIWNRKKNGELIAEWQNIFAIKDESGAVTHYASIFTDITKRKRIEHRLEQDNRDLKGLAFTDKLTGIGNRLAVEAAFLSIVETSIVQSQPYSIVLADVDDFKPYNDRYGHLDGDHCLSAVAASMKRTLRTGDFLGRFGGEEFIIILPNTDKAGVERVGEKMRQAVWELDIPHADSAYGRVTVSIGCCTVVPELLLAQEESLRFADTALYKAKKRGKNCVEAAS